MEWHVTVFGDLELPSAKQVEAWKALVADPDAFDDWGGELGAKVFPSQPVSAAIAELASLPSKKGDPGRVDIAATGARVKVRGYLEDEGFRTYATLLATAFRAASGAGGKGELHVVQIAGDFAYAIHVEPGASSFAEVKGARAIERLDRSPAGKEAGALYAASFGPPKDGQRFAPAAASAKGAGVYERILARLEARPEGEVYEALKARGGVILTGLAELKPVAKVFPDAQALRSALREGKTDVVRSLGLELLGRLDPEGAAPLAIAALDEGGDLGVRSTAAFLLRESTDPEALRVLLGALQEPPLDRAAPLRTRAVMSLATVKAPAVGEQALALLTPEVIDRADNAQLVLAVLDVAAKRGTALPEPLARALSTKRSEPLIRERAEAALAVKTPARKGAARSKAPAAKAKKK
jgi:hypothetical protein